MIFGSTAIKHWYPSDYKKEPKDVDILSRVGVNSPGIEYHWADCFQYAFDNSFDQKYMDPYLLYTVKVSHLPWEGKNGKWWKHLSDVIFLQEQGCELDYEFLALLHKEWGKRFGDKSRINLNKTAEKFFNDGMKRKYNHDQLHEYFKFGEVPAYKLILKEDNLALVDKELFDSLSREDQLRTVVEEIFVVAFERGLSFGEGYKHIVTRISKGWWNLFAILNAREILDGFKEEKKVYYNLRRSLDNGKV